MSLTYKKEEVKSTRIVTERTVSTPKSWGMFTSRGNNALTKEADKLIIAVDVQGITTTEKIAALTNYMKGWARICKQKSTTEANDTAVRTCIWEFFNTICHSIRLHQSADELWELLEGETSFK